MKRNVLVFSLFACVVGSAAFAQQDKLLTHFIFDKMSLNPGATGTSIPADGLCATSLYRNQWDKVNGAPNSAILNVESRLERWFPGRTGISFYHDAIGFTRQNNVLLNYAFPIDINGVGELAIGAGLGIQNIGMDPTWVPPTTLNDNTLPTGYGTTQLDANFGIYFKGNEPFYVGLSSTHLPASSFESNDAPTPITYDAARHYYLMGGYKYMGLGPGDLEGNVLVRTDIVKYSADVNVRYIWQNQAYGGLTYRTSDAVAIMLGAQPFKMMNGDTSPLDHFIIGYSYDVSINKLSSISRGSHEILMKYCYYLPPIPIAKSKHPRWL